MTHSSDETNLSKPDELPGGEFPRAVYRSVAAAFAWMILTAWIAFGSGREPDFTLAFASLIMIVGFALPLLIRVTARHHIAAEQEQEPLRTFLSTDVDIATGWISGRDAWIEVAIIPVALALAATLIGLVYVLDGIS